MVKTSELSFFLVSNFHTYGIQHALYDYLKKRTPENILFLNHPLHGVSTDGFSELTLRNNNKKRYSRSLKIESLNYIYDLFLTLRIGFTSEKTDIYIGFNSMNTLPGIILKFFGKTKYVITYSHSFKKIRFKNKILNFIYKTIDLIAIRLSDSVWGLSDSLTSIRVSQGVEKNKIIHVPDGVDTELIKPLKNFSDKKYRLVFLGLINEINGLSLVIDSLPELIKKFPKITLDIIGDGEDINIINEKIKKNNLKKYIKFHGILSITQISKVLPSFGVGLATYKPIDDTTLKTTDPMKTKLYMASGLPIISTNLYKTAYEIEKYNLGVLISYDKTNLIKAIEKIFNTDRYNEFRNNCIKFSKSYDWEIIFDTAFKKLVLK